MNTIQKLRDEEWRKEWRGIHLPPTASCCSPSRREEEDADEHESNDDHNENDVAIHQLPIESNDDDGIEEEEEVEVDTQEEEEAALPEGLMKHPSGEEQQQQQAAISSIMEQILFPVEEAEQHTIPNDGHGSNHEYHQNIDPPKEVYGMDFPSDDAMVAMKKDEDNSASGDGEATYYAMAWNGTFSELKLALLSSNQEASTANDEASSLPEPIEGFQFDAVVEHGAIDFVIAHDDIQKSMQELGGGNNTDNDNVGPATVAEISAAAAAGNVNESSSYPSGPSVPLYPLLLTIAFHFILKLAFGRKERKPSSQTMQRIESRNRFVITQEGLEEQIRLLRFNLEKTKAVIARLERENEDATANSNGVAESSVALKGENKRLLADLDSFKSQNRDLRSQLNEATANQKANEK